MKAPKHCKECGKPATQARSISRRGLCTPCAVRRFKAAQRTNQAGGVLADPVARAAWLRGITQAAERLAAQDAATPSDAA